MGQVAGKITVEQPTMVYVQVHINLQRQLGKGKLAIQLCSQIGQMVGVIIVRHLYTKYRYRQISKAS